MKRNSKIQVVASEELEELKLSELVDRSGIIIEDLSYAERKHKGCIVLFPKSFMDEYIWYIPIESIKCEK